MHDIAQVATVQYIHVFISGSLNIKYFYHNKCIRYMSEERKSKTGIFKIFKDQHNFTLSTETLQVERYKQGLYFTNGVIAKLYLLTILNKCLVKMEIR